MRGAAMMKKYMSNARNGYNTKWVFNYFGELATFNIQWLYLLHTRNNTFLTVNHAACTDVNLVCDP